MSTMCVALGDLPRACFCSLH